MTRLQSPPLSLYIHIPWCVQKCPYCDFNSHAINDSLPEQQYINALLADLEQDLALVEGRTIETLFIGGGTPSLVSGDAIETLLQGIKNRVAVADDAEITLEANPGTVDKKNFFGYRAAGINRLSIGVQSFNDKHLEKLGRIHDHKDAIEAVETAQHAGFDKINVDLMFGLPDQTLNEAVRDIEMALDLGVTHISHYQLTLEPNTRFFLAPPELPKDDVIWRSQTHCHSLLVSEAFHCYEISAFAKGASQCRHNLNYWQFGDYLGIGAGAHAKITDIEEHTVRRIWKQRHPKLYLDTAHTSSVVNGERTINRDELPLEFLMNGLRLKTGFNINLFLAHTGLSLSVLEPVLSDLIVEGLLTKTSNRIQCTDKGWLFLDDILQRFFPDTLK
ncbi:MAG: radical SAM family heme chaperone HemW [Methylococcales bacterium]